jgi:choloylglycine hydrolase
MKTRGLQVALVLVCGFAVLASAAAAGTGIRLTAKDGSIISARTMESGMDLQSNMLIVPRNYAMTGTGYDNTKGMQWTTKYGYVGPNVNGQNWVCDGLNEKGLAVSSFMFPANNNWNTTVKQKTNQTMTPYQVASYVLGTCATVQDAITTLRSVRVWNGNTNTTTNNTNNTNNNTNNSNWVGTWNYAIYDNQGHSVVMQYTDGQWNVQENTQGVVTNSTAFRWNLNGLRNYIHNATPAAGAQQCVWQAFHLLNQFDVPVGMVYANAQNKWTGGYTNWTTAADMTHLRYYFHTYQNRQVQMIDLNKVNLNAKTIKTVAMPQEETVNDLSGNVN